MNSLINFLNDKEKHHFLSQVEQRFNCCNPQASNKNKRIFSFKVSERELYELEPYSKKGTSISGNLKMLDLFSFDVLGDSNNRYNFEDFFQSYEDNIKENTESIINKLDKNIYDIKSEVLEVFRFKILNFFRNPYCIEKILYLCEDIKGKVPTDPIDYANFKHVLEGKKPHQSHLCKVLGITEESYKEWLAAIFILLNPMEENGFNILDQVISRIVENDNFHTEFHVFSYDNRSCLLSDRSFNLYTEDKSMIWEFNLCSRIFIRYCFIDILGCGISKEVFDSLKRNNNNIKVQIHKNDIEALKIYNKRTVSFCHENVFGASKEYEGLTVLP
ncbi:hypothetical protein [Psychrobacter aquimaris]|uniref:hypothetical protein n=1 Tax=Psychrobacter aquimaris TaxID=292733 RepID=UPI003FD3A4AA